MLLLSVLNNCSVEKLLRLANEQPEMSAQEKQLDNYFDLLKQNRVDEHTSVDGLDKLSNFYQVFFIFFILKNIKKQKFFRKNSLFIYPQRL